MTWLCMHPSYIVEGNAERCVPAHVCLDNSHGQETGWKPTLPYHVDQKNLYVVEGIIQETKTMRCAERSMADCHVNSDSAWQLRGLRGRCHGVVGQGLICRPIAMAGSVVSLQCNFRTRKAAERAAARQTFQRRFQLLLSLSTAVRGRDRFQESANACAQSGADA
jgi:hypothetical protein